MAVAAVKVVVALVEVALADRMVKADLVLVVVEHVVLSLPQMLLDVVALVVINLVEVEEAAVGSLAIAAMLLDVTVMVQVVAVVEVV